MASASTKLFLPSHRKASSTSSSSGRQESSRSRFPTSSTFDLRHSIPEESTSATEPSFPSLPSSNTLTVKDLNHQLSPRFNDATLRPKSFIDADRSYWNHASRPNLPRSYSSLDITTPFEANTQADRSDPLASPLLPTPGDDDDDIDTNPLFLHLSEQPHLARDWNLASLALIPLARTLITHAVLQPNDLTDPDFVALHAFAPSKLYKHQFVSVRSLTHASVTHPIPSVSADAYDWSRVTLTATIETDSKSVTIAETVHAPAEAPTSDGEALKVAKPSVTTKRKVTIVGDTTIYRTVPAPPPTSHTDDASFQVTSRALPSKDTPAPSAKVRVLSVDFPIVHRKIPNAGTPTMVSSPLNDAEQSFDSMKTKANATISDLILEHVPAKRSFAADLAILANPSAPSSRINNALQHAFDMLFSAAHQFAASFVYVKGFDTYNAHRIRRGIWFKAWKAFEERLGPENVARLSVEAFHRIKSLLESVVMGLVDTKMYGPIQDQLMDADLVTEEVLSTYNASNVSLADFGVQNTALKQRPARLAEAIAVLSQGLRDDGGPELDEALTSGDAELLKAIAQSIDKPAPGSTESCPAERINSDLGLALPSPTSSTQKAPGVDLHRRTPLQILQTLRAAIDQVGWAVERVHQFSIRSMSSPQERPPPLGTDDLLPILSYVFVRARTSRLCSMLYYARTFQLTDTATSPELQWALVTCDAVVSYLRSDPLRLCRRRSSSILAADVSRKSSQSQHSSSMHASEPLFGRSMSSRSYQGSSAASSLQVGMPMAKSTSGPNETSAIEATPPQSPRSPLWPAESIGDYISASGSNSQSFRHADTSIEHGGGAYANSEASPCLAAEGFKLPGLPASISSRRNSRILQQRPTSIFSLSEDGDAVSLGQDTSIDALDRRLSAVVVSQSPGRRISMRDRRLSSSSSSNAHTDVQIRPQIVRTVKRTQAGNRLERTSSGGSNASSSHVHVRVVGGSGSVRPADTGSGGGIEDSPDKADRRKSFDSWTPFSLFGAGAEAANRSSWISWGTETLVGSSRRNSTSVVVNHRSAPSSRLIQTAKSEDRHAETDAERSTFHFPSTSRSGSESGEPSSAAGSSSASGRRRYRGRFLSTNSAMLAGSAAPLPPQVDRSWSTSGEVINPKPTQAQARPSLGSLDALRATIAGDSAEGTEAQAAQEITLILPPPQEGDVSPMTSVPPTPTPTTFPSTSQH